MPTPPLATALWGCGGFRGAQPMLRFVLLLLAASLARVTLELRVPPGYDEHLKWYATVPPRRASVGPESEITCTPYPVLALSRYTGVLAELRARRPSARVLLALLCASAARRSERLCHDVPAFSSLLIREMRRARPDGAAVAPHEQSDEKGSGEHAAGAATRDEHEPRDALRATNAARKRPAEGEAEASQ